MYYFISRVRLKKKIHHFTPRHILTVDFTGIDWGVFWKKFCTKGVFLRPSFYTPTVWKMFLIYKIWKNESGGVFFFEKFYTPKSFYGLCT